MNRSFAIVAAAVAVLACSAAAETGDDFVSQFFGVTPTVKNKTFACFIRSYDPAHLSAHPEQNVTKMRLLAVDDPQDPDSIDLRVGVNFRSQKALFQAEGSCGQLHGEEGKSAVSTAHCGVACDGGSIDVTLETKGSVLVGIPDGARMWDPNDAGSPPNTSVSRKFGKDDKLFRLDRTALAQCLPLASDAGEKARLKSGK